VASDPNGSKTLRDVLPDDSESVDVVLDRQKIVAVLRQALSTLTPREERVVRLRFGISEEEDNTEAFPISADEYEALKSDTHIAEVKP
jgi:DNA-directed RNA polymerase sigma subunit (sigma70/sigma32)